MKFDFIQIGANVGDTDNDPVYPRVVNGEFKNGILIEANPKCIPYLKANYLPFGLNNFFIENCAIANFTGKTVLYVDNFEVDKGVSQHASLSRDFQVAHDHGTKDVIYEIEVDVKKLEDIYLKYKCAKVSWLFIDTEGADFSIIKSIDFSKVDIDHIQFEHSHLGGAHCQGGKLDNLLNYLGGFGYKFVSSDKEDTIVGRE